MKFLLISDFHLLYDTPVCRKDNVLQAGLNKLKFILDYAEENNCIILQAGDMFDVPRSWRLLAAVQNILYSRSAKIYAIYGQHDNYMYSENSKPSTILGVLSNAGYIDILSSNPVILDKENIKIYGCSYGQTIPECCNEGFNILVIHAPILEQKLWTGQQNYMMAGEFLNRYKQYDLILCGDIHRKFCLSLKNKYIVNTGCILRIEADEYNLTYKPSFAIFDTVSRGINWGDIPHSSSEEIISRKHIVLKKENEKMLDEFVSTIKMNIKDNADLYGYDFKSNLYKYLKVNNISEDIKNIIFETMEVVDARQ